MKNFLFLFALAFGQAAAAQTIDCEGCVSGDIVSSVKGVPVYYSSVKYKEGDFILNVKRPYAFEVWIEKRVRLDDGTYYWNLQDIFTDKDKETKVISLVSSTDNFRVTVFNNVKAYTNE